MSLTTDIYQRIATAKIFIDENYDEPLDSRRSLNRPFCPVFIFIVCLPGFIEALPTGYLTQKRIEKAKQLLAENKAINDVCSEVGFESLGSFSTLFKKEIGFAPTLYRNIAWLKKQEQKKQPRNSFPHCFIESYALDK
jgi:AraC-like DNA-binding protein